MALKKYLNYSTGQLKEKGRRARHFFKHADRYKNVYLSAGLSVVIVASAAAVIAGALIGTSVENDPKDIYRISVGQRPDHYNWLITFDAAQGTPARMMMGNVVTNRSSTMDNIKQIKSLLESPTFDNDLEIKVGNKTYDLKKDEDLAYVKSVINKYEAATTDVPDKYGLLGLPKLEALRSDGSIYTLTPSTSETYALEGAKEVKIYQPGEYNTQNVTNANGQVFEFTLDKDFVWSNGDRVNPKDWVEQLDLTGLSESSISNLLSFNDSEAGNKITHFDKIFDDFTDILRATNSYDLLSTKTENLTTAATNPATEDVDVVAAKTSYDRFLVAYDAYNVAYDAYSKDMANESNEKKLESTYKNLRTTMDEYIKNSNEVGGLATAYTKDRALLQTGNLLEFLDSQSWTIGLNSSKIALFNAFKVSIQSSLNSLLGTIPSTNTAELQELVKQEYTSEAMDSSITLQQRHSSINSFKTAIDNLTKTQEFEQYIAEIETKASVFIQGETFEDIRKKSEIVNAIGESARAALPDSSGKVHISYDFLNFPKPLIPLATSADTTGEVEFSGNGRNSYSLPWDVIMPKDIYNACTSNTLDRTAQDLNGHELKFINNAESKSSLQFYDNMGAFCDSFSLVIGDTSDDDNWKVSFKLAREFSTDAFFELLASTVVFYPMQEKFLIDLGKNDETDVGIYTERTKNESYIEEVKAAIYRIVGADSYGRSPETYLHNGRYSPELFGNIFRVTKNENSPISDYLLPNIIERQYVSAAAQNATTLSFIKGKAGVISLSTEWNKEFQKDNDLANKVELEITNPTVTRSFSFNMFAPQFTNNYFRTPIGEDISWGTQADANNPDSLKVKEYQLKNGVSCEEVENPKRYYPSLSYDNYVCGIIPEYKDFSNAFRRFVSTTYDSGRGFYERGFDTPEPYLFPSETITTAGLVKDDFSTPYTESVARALKEQQSSPIDISDSIYDDAFTYNDENGTATVLPKSDRNKVSFYGSSGYDEDSWEWKSTRQVGFTLARRQGSDQLPDENYQVDDPNNPGQKITLGFTPSYDSEKLKAMWQNIKVLYPEFADRKKFHFFMPLPTTQGWDNRAILLQDYWFDYTASITGNDVTFESMTDKGRQDALKETTFLYGVGQPAYLECTTGDITQAYSLVDSNGDSLACGRSMLATYFGWGYDYREVTNTLGQFTSPNSWNSTSSPASKIQRHILEYWRQNILKFIAADYDNGAGLYNMTKRDEYRKEVNDIFNVVTKPNAVSTFGDVLTGNLLKDDSDNTIKGLTSISTYASSMILGQYEAWRLREGLSMPWYNEGRSVIASRVGNDYVFSAFRDYSYAYNCDREDQARTYQRHYSSASTTKILELTAPNCVETTIIEKLSARVRGV